MREVWKVLGIAAVAICLVFSMTPGKVAAADKVFEFKISVDTVPNHPRNHGLVMFIEELQKRSGGKLVPKYYHSAQLYKDAHVGKAVRTGTVEMAVPWKLASRGVRYKHQPHHAAHVLRTAGEEDRRPDRWRSGESREPVPGKEDGDQIPGPLV